MRISEAKECIKELYKETSVVTALVSERGVGKTSAYEQCAKELGIDYVALYAAAMEGPDFMGLPAKDIERGITRYLAPQFLPTKEAIASGLYQEKGLLILEEINRVPSDTISVLYPLLLEKKINGHELGEGWQIGVTMNPDTLNYMVNALDDAMIDRFVTIEVEVNLEDYLAYSKRHEPNEKVLAFLSDFPDMLLITGKAHESNAMRKSPTPRGWTRVQEIMNRCKLKDTLLQELIAGIVGPVGASALIGYLGKLSISMPSSLGILNDYAIERDKVLKVLEEGQSPVLTKVIDNLIPLLREEDKIVDATDSFLSDLPAELRMYFYKVLSRDHQEIFDYFSERSLIFEEVSESLIDRMMQ